VDGPGVTVGALAHMGAMAWRIRRGRAYVRQRTDPLQCSR